MTKPVDHGAFKHAARVSMHARRLVQVRRDLGDLGDGSRELETTFDRFDSADGALFVNLHTKVLADESLYDERAPLAKIADRVVLEITERARLESVDDVPGRI